MPAEQSLTSDNINGGWLISPVAVAALTIASLVIIVTAILYCFSLFDRHRRREPQTCTDDNKATMMLAGAVVATTLYGYGHRYNHRHDRWNDDGYGVNYNNDHRL